ncbi:BAF_HP2_G0030050.mRNA.1.CDS.1 [Saccharomyces cerevisiae]|nr:BAF_HP2_G0030050.mRNA.1.CDS.1 [Saccharomyces cerevisiae]CAI6454531.1 BAF_HP2_G0030050.mRNA.1.CDS.1 [Saccharomyces cerevisiae]
MSKKKGKALGIGGASGSGKTSVAAKIVSSINVPWTVLISLDSFYNPLGPEDRARAFKNKYDFDEPNAINLDLAYKCILNLRRRAKGQISQVVAPSTTIEFLIKI